MNNDYFISYSVIGSVERSCFPYNTSPSIRTIPAIYISTIQSVLILIICAGAVSNTMAVPPKIAPPLYMIPMAVERNRLLNDSARNTGSAENMSASRNSCIENTMVNIKRFVV